MTITLGKGRAVFSNSEIQTITENEDFRAKIESDAAYANLYAVCMICGKRHTFKIFNDELVIPAKLLKSGDMLLTVCQVKDGNTLNTWYCEKLTFKEADGAYHIIPEIAQLKEELAAMRKEIAETKEYYKGICEGYNII